MTQDLWQELSGRLALLQEDMSQCREAQARMDTKLTTLLGNGQPGRLQVLESQVSRNTKWINRVAGGAVALGGLCSFIITLLHYLH